MVKVEIVKDEADDVQRSPYASSDSDRTASSASLSSVESLDVADESIFDRVAALVDIVPPTTRVAISQRANSAGRFVKRTSKLVGNVIWVFTTSALLIGLPLALALEDEAKIVAQEREMAAQQQGAQQMMSPSMYPQPGQQNKQQGGLVPPGF